MEDTSGNNVVFDLKDEAATINLAREISNLALTGDVIALFGDLGSGKTVFARAFINARTINYENKTVVLLFETDPLRNTAGSQNWPWGPKIHFGTL